MTFAAFATTLILFAQVQPPAPSPEAAEKMKALSFLVGEWEGEGSMRMGPGEPEKASVKESIKLKLSGLAILLEGRGTRKDAAGKEDVVHESLGIISWDGQAKKYVMHAVTARAGSIMPDVQISDKKLVWSFKTPQGAHIRYTITIGPDGKWNEIGEFSPDGNSWNKFFEMLLTKKI